LTRQSAAPASHCSIAGEKKRDNQHHGPLGIKAERLAAAASRYEEIWLAALDRQQSAGSHSITLSRSIDVYERDFPVKSSLLAVYEII